MDGSDSSTINVSAATLYERKRKQQNREAQRRFRQRNQQNDARNFNTSAEEAIVPAPSSDDSVEKSTGPVSAGALSADINQNGGVQAFDVPDIWQMCSASAQSGGQASFSFPHGTVPPTDLGFMSSSSESTDQSWLNSAGLDCNMLSQGHDTSKDFRYWMPMHQIANGRQGTQRPSPVMRSKTTPSSLCSMSLQSRTHDKQRAASDTTHRRSSNRKAGEAPIDQSSDRLLSNINLSGTHTRMSLRADKLCEELSNLYRFGVDMQLLSSDELLATALDDVRSRFQRSIHRALDNDSDMQDSSSAD